MPAVTLLGQLTPGQCYLEIRGAAGCGDKRADFGMHVKPEFDADFIGTVLEAEKLIDDALHGRPDLAERIFKGLLRAGKDLTLSPTARDEAPHAVRNLDKDYSSVNGGEFN
jgi:hypothetical protein